MFISRKKLNQLVLINKYYTNTSLGLVTELNLLRKKMVANKAKLSDIINKPKLTKEKMKEEIKNAISNW